MRCALNRRPHVRGSLYIYGRALLTYCLSDPKLVLSAPRPSSVFTSSPVLSSSSTSSPHPLVLYVARLPPRTPCIHRLIAHGCPAPLLLTSLSKNFSSQNQWLPAAALTVEDVSIRSLGTLITLYVDADRLFSNRASPSHL